MLIHQYTNSQTSLNSPSMGLDRLGCSLRTLKAEASSCKLAEMKVPFVYAEI